MVTIRRDFISLVKYRLYLTRLADFWGPWPSTPPWILGQGEIFEGNSRYRVPTIQSQSSFRWWISRTDYLQSLLFLRGFLNAGVIGLIICFPGSLQCFLGYAPGELKTTSEKWGLGGSRAETYQPLSRSAEAPWRHSEGPGGPGRPRHLPEGHRSLHFWQWPWIQQWHTVLL